MAIYIYPPVSVTTLPPIGGATSANQLAEIAELQNILDKTGKMFIEIDGVYYPVGKDTTDPTNTVSIPVEVSAASGPINITAGDLNVQLSDSGPNPDIVKIGDGVTRLGITTNNEAKTHDADALAQLVLLVAKDFATGAKQDTQITALSDVNAELDTQTARLNLLATDAKLEAVRLLLASLDSKDFSSATKQDETKALLGAINETPPGLDTDPSGLNGRLTKITQKLTAVKNQLPSVIGQNAKADSLSVTIASDQEALSVKPKAITASFDEKLTLTTVDTFVAPANAIGGKIYAKTGNPGNVVFKQGGAATATSGIFLEGGRSEELTNGSNVSVISESGSNVVSIIWNIQA